MVWFYLLWRKRKYLPLSPSYLTAFQGLWEKNVYLVSLASALCVPCCFCSQKLQAKCCKASKKAPLHLPPPASPEWHIIHTDPFLLIYPVCDSDNSAVIVRKWKWCTQTPLGTSWLQETQVVDYLLPLFSLMEAPSTAFCSCSCKKETKKCQN